MIFITRSFLGKLVFLILMLVLTDGCSINTKSNAYHLANPTPKTVANPVPIKDFIKTNWITVNDISEVGDDKLSDFYPFISGVDKRLARNGSPIDNTDIDTTLPNRRFVMFGTAENKRFFLYEKSGVFGLTLVVFDKLKEKVSIVLHVVALNCGAKIDNLWNVDLQQIQSALAQGNFSMQIDDEYLTENMHKSNSLLSDSDIFSSVERMHKGNL